MISVAHNIAQFERGLSDLAQRQLPFATALALNDTAGAVKDAWSVHLERRLDRPTPFTKRGIYQRRASKARLTAEVGMKDIQAGYLSTLVQGGTRLPAGRALLVPVRQRVNQYGNLPRGAVRRLLARDDVFSGKVGRGAGIFQRGKSRKKAPRLLISYQPSARYTRMLDLRTAAEGRARAEFPRRFSARLRQALATAR